MRSLGRGIAASSSPEALDPAAGAAGLLLAADFASTSVPTGIRAIEISKTINRIKVTMNPPVVY